MNADVTENDEDGTQNIYTTYNALLPFVVSTGEIDDTNTDNYWYFINFYASNHSFHWYSNENLNTWKEHQDLNVTTLSEENLPKYMYRLQGDWLNGFTIQNKSDNKYLAAPAGFVSGTACTSVATVDTDEATTRFMLEYYTTYGFSFKPKGSNLFVAHTSNNTSTGLNITCYLDNRNESYDGNQIYFTAANTNSKQVTVTYTYMLDDGQEIGSLTATETVGAAPANVLPEYATPYVTATGAPAVIGKSEGQTYTIETSYNNTLPFNVSSGESNSWYIINLYDRYYWYSGDATYGTEKDGRTDYGCTVENVDYFLWKIEGNWLDGFRFASRDGRYLAAPTDSPENPNNYNDAATANKACLLSSEEDLAGHEDRSKFYLIHPLNDNKTIKTDEWQLLLKSGHTRLAHTNDPGNGNTIFINFYNKNNNDSYYVGSAVKFDPFDEDFNSDFFNKLPSLAEDGSLPSRAGYPAPETEVAVALQEAMANTTYKYFPALKTAWNAYAASTENIVMPEDGKAYYLRNISPVSGDAGYLFYYDGSQLNIENYTEENKNDKSMFVCHKLENGKYLFVNATMSDYVCWRSGNDGYNKTGFTSSYLDDYCGFTLTSFNNAAHPGTFTLKTARRNTNNGNEVTFCIKAGGTGSFDAYSTEKCFGVVNGNYYSNLFRLEEADYTYNNVTLRGADGANWATLYLPFSTVIPENVEAYTANLNDTGDKLTLFPVNGNTLPKATAVVLHSTTQTQAVFAPSTESGTAVEKNALQGTMSTTQEREGNNIYALGNPKNSGVGFYPYTASTLPAGKAYLQLNGTSAPALLFDFGGEVTGIDAAATAAANDAPVYDLSGRRVAGTTKGLYIVGGKKVLVK